MDVVERVRAVLDEIAELHPEGTVLVATHGFTMAVAVCLALNIDLNTVFEQIPGNAEFTRVEWTSRCCQPAMN